MYTFLEPDRVKKLCQEFFQRFEEKLGSNNCAELKAKYRKEDTGCRVIIEAAAQILDDIVIRELQANN
ncbi:C-GCAxxG-C-C family protein [Clostridium sp. CS001]|uniref:C-GCAxxG-C-C family (seleno)protein n=1 Tax=Clostridium sp. CS001 TaxID=2880648 RepID=UPI001CF5CED8|nr:C-GCAxxG-C-C family (seleno)protein [Clostridium sp. CS001]MCB2290200.1 C-GCAxxG-C-C family protein [Clostridium sp. CS001]